MRIDIPPTHPHTHSLTHSLTGDSQHAYRHCCSERDHHDHGGWAAGARETPRTVQPVTESIVSQDHL